MKLISVIPSDETLRRMLAVEHPATFRDQLRHPMNGPEVAAWTEKRIDLAKRNYAAIVDSLQPELQWQDYLNISELPDVDECIRNLLEDHTEDNAVCMVRAIIEAVKNYEPK